MRCIEAYTSKCIEQIALLIVAYGWPPSEFEPLTLSEMKHYWELAKVIDAARRKGK